MYSTIIKKKKQLICGCYDYPFSKNRCKYHATVEDSMKRINEHTEQEEGLSELIKEADTVFSKYIRQKYADKKGNVKCYTCDTVLPISQIQCGHYVSRYSMFLRFDERNARPQCEYCNCHKHGNLSVFGKNLEQEHKGITEILYEEATTIYKYTRDELKQLILSYQQKLKQPI